MKRRRPACLVLVGWGGTSGSSTAFLREPVACGRAATHVHATYAVPACAEHVDANARKDLTLVRGPDLLVGSGRGSRYERIAPSRSA